MRKSSSEYIDTMVKKPLQYKKPKQVVTDNHHSGSNIARTLLNIFGIFLFIVFLIIFRIK